MEGERRYGQRETALILRKAAQLQARETGAPADEQGFSLSELEAAAGEAGVSAEYVRRAAAELSGRAGAGKVNSFLGGETKVAERLVLPFSCARDDLEAALLEMPELAGAEGTGNTSAEAMTWTINGAQSMESGRSLIVRIRPAEGGGTEIMAKSDMKYMAVGVYGGIMGGLGIGAGIGVGLGVGLGAGIPLMAARFPAGILGATYLLSRILYCYFLERTRRENGRIVHALREFLEKRRERLRA